MFYIRLARQKRNQNMPKVFFIYKMEHHNLWNECENKIFNSNGSFYNFYLNLPKISIIHKMSKIKALLETSTFLCTQNGNFQVKSAIL